MLRHIVLISILFILSATSIAQDKMVIDDRGGILSESLEKTLEAKLAEQGISYTSMVDFRTPCSYYYTGLEKSGNDLILTIMDCDKKKLGARNLGSSIASASGEEQALLLYFAIRDIIAEPGKYLLNETPSVQKTTAEPEMQAVVRKDSVLTNEHDSRYFFAPSAYNLKKGELYYNTVYFFLHDIQFGINDHFSMGLGTSIIGLPLYLTPKVSFPLGEKNSLGVGDLLMLGTWGTDFMGNLAYGVFTHGDVNGNFTIGAGHLWTNYNEITRQTSSLVANFSALARLTPFMFFMNENYVMSANFLRSAVFYSGMEYVEEEFEQRNTFLYGIMGIRLISKSRSFMAWQFGLTYIVNYAGDYDPKYDSWDLDYRTRTPGDLNLFAIPTATFTVKFGVR